MKDEIITIIMLSKLTYYDSDAKTRVFVQNQ